MIHESLNSALLEVNKQTESIILSQLNELISRGLLVIESTQPVLVADYDLYHNGTFNRDKPYNIRLQQMVKLKLKDQEYIEKLEKENEELKKQVHYYTASRNEPVRSDY